MATILLVDDVKLFIELEKSFLEDAGHQVVTASSGEEAMGLLDETDPALMLVDLYMQGIDGGELCRRLRNTPRWKNLPIIIVTSAGKDEEVRKCLDAGCDDYITKPIQKNVLVEKVQRLLGAVRARTAQRKQVCLKVHVRSEKEAFEATARDLSRNGIFVSCDTRMPPGTHVKLTLILEQGRKLTVLGKVKRLKDGPDGGMGIYFIRPEEQGQKVLDDLLKADPAAPLADPDVAEEETVYPRLGDLQDENAALRSDNQALLRRIAELEDENQEFAQRIVTSEEVNNNLTNLYIASSRLHSVLNRSEVITIIQEVAINLVGAEKFALLLFDKDSGSYRFESGEGFEEKEFAPVEPGAGLLGRVIAQRDHFFQDGPFVEGSDDPQAPLAAVPLCIDDDCIGLLSIYRLFVHKEQFEPIDYQLFSMMAEQAATALFTSTLYEASERKRQTYQGFVELLLN